MLLKIFFQTLAIFVGVIIFSVIVSLYTGIPARPLIFCTSSIIGGVIFFSAYKDKLEAEAMAREMLGEDADGYEYDDDYDDNAEDENEGMG